MDTTSEDESYNLLVNDQITVTSKTILGAINAITTLNQLLECDGSSCSIPNGPFNITDSPKYTYRGILIDVARNFIPLSILYEAVDTMSTTKLNMLHIHLSDTQSFPLEIEAMPELAEAAAYKNKTFSREEIQGLVHYAKVRGIRVMPEIDSPGHAPKRFD